MQIKEEGVWVFCSWVLIEGKWWGKKRIEDEDAWGQLSIMAAVAATRYPERGGRVEE